MSLYCLDLGHKTNNSSYIKAGLEGFVSLLHVRRNFNYRILLEVRLYMEEKFPEYRDLLRATQSLLIHDDCTTGQAADFRLEENNAKEEYK